MAWEGRTYPLAGACWSVLTPASPWKENGEKHEEC